MIYAPSWLLCKHGQRKSVWTRRRRLCGPAAVNVLSRALLDVLFMHGEEGRGKNGGKNDPNAGFIPAQTPRWREGPLIRLCEDDFWRRRRSGSHHCQVRLAQFNKPSRGNEVAGTLRLALPLGTSAC